MSKKRRDTKDRVLRTGESQRPDGRYAFKYTDRTRKVRFLYSWRLEPGDPIPKGKREKPALRELERQIRRDLEDGIIPQGGDMTVAALVQNYLAQKGSLRQRTLRNYRNLQKLLENDPFGQMRIDRVKSSNAKAWVSAQREKGKKFNTIHNYQTVLRPAFQMAVDDDLIRKNPFAFRLSTVLSNNSTPRFALSPEQEKAFLDYISETGKFRRYYYNGIYILLHTGLRISELVGLVRKDLDFSHDIIHVRRQLHCIKGGVCSVETPKTDNGVRDIPMSPQVKLAFQHILSDRPRGIEFKRIIQRYNATHPEPLPNITPHICRHTFATNMARAGMSPKALQLIMGHSSIKVTLDVYTHLEVADIVHEFQKVSGAGQ